MPADRPPVGWILRFPDGGYSQPFNAREQAMSWLPYCAIGTVVVPLVPAAEEPSAIVKENAS